MLRPRGLLQGEYHTEAAAALAYDRAMVERDGPDSLTNSKVFGQALLDGKRPQPTSGPHGPLEKHWAVAESGGVLAEAGWPSPARVAVCAAR